MSGHLMRSVALLIAVALAASGAHAQQVTAFVGARLIDGTGRPPVPDAVVVVRDGRIACAGPRRACAVPTGARVHDLPGRWIMPGVIDAHVHYSQTGWADGRPDALDLRERFPYTETVAALRDPTPFYRAHLCTGVTATFDVGGYPWTWTLREPAERDASAPHVVAAGPLLSTRDFWLNVPGERQFVHIPTDSAVDAGVRYVAANGTDAVKVWFLVGATNPDTTGWSQRLMRVGRAAREAGRPLIVHATSLWGAKQALRAGATLLVHSVEDQLVDDEFLDLARRHGTVYTPTLVVHRGYVQLRARQFDAAAYGESLRCVDARTRAKAFLTDSVSGRPPATALARDSARHASRFQTQLENVRRVHTAGIPIAMGTDAGNPLTLHGPSAYLEMEALQQAGLSPMEVIVAATAHGARAMGRERDLGTLEAGKVADLVVLTADPTADIRNVRQVDLVVRAGTVHRRADLAFPLR